MLRASWALITLPCIPGARSRLDKPIPACFYPGFYLGRQDRYFVSSQKYFNVKGSISTDATPEVASDTSTGTRKAAPDTFTPSTSISPVLRFPPFPLAVVEEVKPAPRVPAEAEPETNTDFFEPPSSEYVAASEYIEVHRRLPEPTLAQVDILTQVVRTLPEILPEPETDPDSIFEDVLDADYAGLPISTPSPIITSTQSLEMLVAEKDYDQALRVLDVLLELGTQIPFAEAYEAAALSAIEAPAQTKEELDGQIVTFRKWFSLVPTAKMSRPRTLEHISARIMLSPWNCLPLMMEFALIAAEKGFAATTYYSVTRAIALYDDADAILHFVEELPRRNRVYLEQSVWGRWVEELDRRFHVDVVCTAVRALAKAGRFDLAVQLIPDPTETDFHLTPYTYTYFLAKAQHSGDSRYVPHINFVAQHNSLDRFREFGLKRMDKQKLGVAIQCLASVGEVDFALGLLPHFVDAKAALLAQTLDFLLELLGSHEQERYAAYIDSISQLREAITEPSIDSAPTAEIAEDSIIAMETPKDFASTPNGSPTAVHTQETRYDHVMKNLIVAWCLDEALALLPTFQWWNAGRATRIYNLLLWKLKASCNSNYKDDFKRIKQLKDEEAAARRRAIREANNYLKDFTPEEVQMSSSMSSSAPQRVTKANNLGSILRSLKKGFKALTQSERPHVLTIVRFIELYVESGRTTAIPLLRRFVLSHTYSGGLYIFAEMLYHARHSHPDLVIRTFVTHFYIVGLPREELSKRMLQMEHSPTDALWEAQPTVKLNPGPAHVATVWRALLETIAFGDYSALEELYGKLVQFSTMSVPPTPLHSGIPLLSAPPSWHTGADPSAFTPFVRRISQTFGAERGAVVLKHMFERGIKPSIYHLTELAMEYSRSGDVAKTMNLVSQIERAADEWDAAGAVEKGVEHQAARQQRAQSSHLIPRVDQVFYIAVMRGFIKSNHLVAARDVERLRYKRFGYAPGNDPHLDELYIDLRAAEEGKQIAPSRPPSPLSTAVATGGY
ncbi:hypothetical protein C8R43DRAFT_364606 [Mycena crocata]|nr:hypothetical protein C8R43DRAFT_364606 [Mycena crocata]